MKKRIFFGLLLSFCGFSLTAKNIDSLEILAYVSFKKNEFNNAINLYSSLITANKNNSEFYFYRGKCFFSIRDYENAKSDFLEVEESYRGKASLYLTKIFTLQANYNEAFRYLENYLESKYKISESEIISDTLIQKLHNMPEWNNIWKENYYSIRDNFYSEVEYLKKYGKYDEAIELIDLQLGKGSKNNSLYALKADILMDMKEYKLAANEYNRVIKSSKRNSDYYIQRAEAYCQIKEYKKAVDDLLTAIEYNPVNVHLYRRLSKIAVENKDYDKANQYMTLYLKYYDNDIDAVYELGNIYFESGNYFNALKYYNIVLKQRQDMDFVFIARGKAYLKTNTYKFAENDFAMALDLNPYNPETYLQRGLARLKRGNNEGACNDWQKAAEIGNKQAIILLSEYCEK